MKNSEKKQLLEEIPKVLPVIPTMDIVVFPNMVVPLLVLDEKIIKGINEALDGDKQVLLLAAKPQEEGYQGPIGIQDLYEVGTVANVMRAMNLPDGGLKVLVQGVVKASVEEILPNEDVLRVKVCPEPIESSKLKKEQFDIRVKHVVSLLEETGEAGGLYGIDLNALISQVNDPERLVDFILSHVSLNVEQLQELLSKKSIDDMLDCVRAHLESKVEVAKVEEQIRNNTRESINKSQREYFLREQLKSIQKELGDDSESDIQDLKNKLESIEMPEEAKSEATKQLRRLERTSPDSLEATVLRNHLEWMFALPWGIYTKDNVDIKHAKVVLDEDHYGLDLIKDRILDALAVIALKDDGKSPILCFSGPPGVGKTSLGQSIAKAMGREFARISMGGVHDESEIRGHRRTYVGALPGRFVQAIRKAGSMNAIMMIDEVDKVGNSGKGDPSSALLEVLDPEQNSTFYDNYLGVHLDLSKVMFIATANDLSAIPGPLRDRMEIIQLAGYTREEKCEIAQRHLVEKAMKLAGVDGKGIEINKEVLDELIDGYTRESGVRSLERMIQKLCSKFARSILEGTSGVKFTAKNLPDYIGPRMVPVEEFEHKSKIGVTNGLAWTPYGGEVLQVEAVLMPGTGKFILTGQLGDVMKESAQAAVSYARAHAEDFGIDREMFTDYDLHIHVPAGATPKDGPSAGVTLLSSIFSVLTKRPINGDFAMTGELNLQGLVLPIGGVKEKILAAKQHGLHHIILPMLNQADMSMLNGADKDLDIHFVSSVEEVLDHVLLPTA
jgi:ATP-dependent Lon protease